MDGRKKQIINEAVKLFAQHGYEKTSINDINKACDIARGTFYIYFQNKTDLLIAMNDMIIEDLLIRLKASLQEKQSKELIMATVVDMVFEYFGDKIDLLRISYVSGDRVYSKYMYETLWKQLVPLLVEKMDHKDETTKHWTMMKFLGIRAVLAKVLLYAPENTEMYKKLLKES
jgi:AcrR family transcriptional regulator